MELGLIVSALRILDEVLDVTQRFESVLDFGVDFHVSSFILIHEILLAADEHGWVFDQERLELKVILLVLEEAKMLQNREIAAEILQRFHVV